MKIDGELEARLEGSGPCGRCWAGKWPPHSYTGRPVHQGHLEALPCLLLQPHELGTPWLGLEVNTGLRGPGASGAGVGA